MSPVQANTIIIVAAFLGFLAGSVPTGFLMGKARGIDIRKVGSGNIGATNVLRILGKKAGGTVLALDAFKGWVAAWFGPFLLRSCAGAAGTDWEWVSLVAGVAAILGHNYTPWLRFKGGKGIATTAGVLLALMPAALGICLAVWLGTFLVSRYVSLASIAAAVALPVGVLLIGAKSRLVILATVLGLLAIYKHRANIKRLRDGTEHRFVKKAPEGGNGGNANA